VFGFCAQNIGNARVKGVESSINVIVVRDLPFMKRVSFDGQYTYTSTEDLRTGDRLARWPVHQSSASLTYQPIEPLNMTGTFRYVGSRFSTTGNQRPLPDFYIFNFSTTYQVNTTIEVYTRVENLFDRKYEEVLFFGTPGRSIWGGVRVNFEVPVLSDSLSND
jgi:vitamin B12 transporter